MSEAKAYEVACARGVKIIGDCYVYQGAKNALGYGVVRPGRGRLYRVHRVVLAVKLGRPLAAHEVTRHLCDNPPCINPDHLSVGSQAENLADMVERGRHAADSLTECSNGHPYGPDTPPRGSHNRCRECTRERNRKYHARKRDAHV